METTELAGLEAINLSLLNPVLKRLICPICKSPDLQVGRRAWNAHSVPPHINSMQTGCTLT